MKVYLTSGRSFEFVSKGGSKIEKYAPSKAFVRVPDEVGKAWVAEGIAYESSDANEILAWDSELGRHVSLSSEQLEPKHLPGTPEVLKDPTPPPFEVVQPSPEADVPEVEE